MREGQAKESGEESEAGEEAAGESKYRWDIGAKHFTRAERGSREQTRMVIDREEQEEGERFGERRVNVETHTLSSAYS